MKQRSIYFFIFSALVTSPTHPALDPRQEIPLLECQLILPPLPQEHSAFTIAPSPQPTPPSVLPKVAGLAGTILSWARTDTILRSVCPKHNLPIHFDTQSTASEIHTRFNHACHDQHAHLPQNEQEARLAQHLQDKQQGLPPLPDTNLSRGQFPLPLAAWHIPLARDPQGNILGLAHKTEQQIISSPSTRIQQKYSRTSPPEWKTKLQQLTTQALESVQDRPEALQDTIAEELGLIALKRETAIDAMPPEQRGELCARFQTKLEELAWDGTKNGDFARTVNATSASMRIDQAIDGTKHALYTRSADKIIQDVMKTYRHRALAKATRIDISHPEIAKKMLFGGQEERLYLAPFLTEKLDLPPRLTALIRGVEKGSCNFADGMATSITHPIATIEKIIVAAHKIAGAIDHFIANDFILKAQRDLLMQQQAHRTLATWEQEELQRILAEINKRKAMPTFTDAWRTAQNLTIDDITTLASSITSTQGIEQISQLTTELGLGILTGKATGSLVGTGADSFSGAGLYLAGDGVAALTESTVVSTNVASQTGMVAVPLSQIIHAMGDDGHSHNSSNLPNQPEIEPHRHTAPVEIHKDQAQHIFRDAKGHFKSDTPENRKLLIDMASDQSNFVGPDEYGNEHFAQVLPDGRQLWAEVRKGRIRNGGINETPRPYNRETGLKSPIAPKRNHD